MFRSTVAVISSKQSDSGVWKSLRVLPLESYPLSFKINKSTIWMQADEKNRRVLLKSREGVQALNLNAEKVVLLGGEEFKIKCKKDITLLSQDSLKQSFGYSFVFHIAVMVLASIYMILNPMEVKVPEVKESISLNEVKELLKKVDEPPVVALQPKPEPPPPAPTPDPKPVEVVRAPQPKPAPVRPAPAPRNPTPVAKAPAEPVRKVAPKARGSAMQARQAVHTAPPTPNPAQVANRKAAKSLAFLSSSAGSFALADNKFSNSTVGGVAADAALSATASVGATQQGSKVLQGMARGGQASGPIQTRGSHGIGNPTAFEGHENGRDFENVQGRVAASSLQGAGNISVRMPASGLSLSGSGNISESLLEKILAKHIDRLRYCYERQLLSDATLKGRLTMQWTISTSGKPSDVRVADSQLNNTRLHSCVSSEIAKISFPKISGGNVQIRYPFMFESQSI